MADGKIVHIVNDDSSDDDLIPIICRKEFSVKEVQVQKVLTVCPHLDAKQIVKDLQVSGGPSETINRIFDGQFLSGIEKEGCSTMSKDDIPNPMLFDCVQNATPGSSLQPIPLDEKLSDTDLDTDTDDNDIIVIKNEREKMYTSLKDRIINKNTGSEVIKEIDLTMDDNHDDDKLNSRVNVGPSLCVSDSDSEDELPVFLSKKYPDKKDNIQNTVRTNDSLLSSTTKFIGSCDDNSYDKYTYLGGSFSSASKLDIDQSPDIDFDNENLPLSAVARSQFSSKDSSPLKRTHSTSNKTDDLFDQEPAVNTGSLVEPKKKKTRKTPEEIMKAKEQAQERKALKEREKEAKNLEKEKKRKAAVEKKMAKEKYKLEKKAESMTYKSQKRDECLKLVVAIIDPGVLKDLPEVDGTNEIFLKLQSMGAQYRLEPQVTHASVIWQRADVKHTVNSEMQIAVEKMYSDENQLLVRIETPAFVDMINGFCAARQGTNDSTETLLSLARRLKQLHKDKRITFVVMGIEKYFRNQKTNKQRNFRDAALRSNSSDMEFGLGKQNKSKKSNTTAVISRLDMEEGLVVLQLRTGCTVRMCETAEQLADLIAMFTKAVAEAPFKKKQQPQGLEFCVEGGDKPSVKVTRQGEGLSKLWSQQIQQFRNVSAEMAAAIISEYPSPQSLIQAYRRCYCEEEASKLLENILVRRGAGILATTRRIGPDLSRRVHLLFTSENGKTSMQK